MFPGIPFSLDCKKCNCKLEMDSYAIDTHTCQNKHVFFFKCPECGGFSATAMSNIPQDLWPEFIPADKLQTIITEYNLAMKKAL